MAGGLRLRLAVAGLPLLLGACTAWVRPSAPRMSAGHAAPGEQCDVIMPRCLRMLASSSTREDRARRGNLAYGMSVRLREDQMVTMREAIDIYRPRARGVPLASS